MFVCLIAICIFLLRVFAIDDDLPLFEDGETPNPECIHMIALSDTHIGGPWFSGASVTALPRFLTTLTYPNTTVHSVMLNGDFLDSWLYKFNEQVPTFAELLRSEDARGINVTQIVDILRQVQRNGVRLVVIRGNHDMEVQASDYESVGLPVTFVESILFENNYRVEHGNRYSLFDAPDPAGFIKSFSYIVTRAYAENGDFADSQSDDNADDTEKNRRFEGSHSKLLDWICDHILAELIPLKSIWRNNSALIERIVGGALGEKIWEEPFNRKYEEYKNHWMKNGCTYFGNWEDIQLGRHTQKFRTLFGRWLDAHDVKIVEHMVQASCDDYDYFIGTVNEDLMVMGHTHNPMVKSYQRSTYKGGYVVYANSGSWTLSANWYSFLRIVTPPGGGNASKVELVKWDDATGFQEVVSASRVPYTDGSNVLASVRPATILAQDRLEGSRPTKTVPPEWNCDPDFYGSNDGCDCACGAPDPDCSCAEKQKCSAIGTEMSCCNARSRTVDSW